MCIWQTTWFLFHKGFPLFLHNTLILTSLVLLPQKLQSCVSTPMAFSFNLCVYINVCSSNSNVRAKNKEWVSCPWAKHLCRSSNYRTWKWHWVFLAFVFLFYFHKFLALKFGKWSAKKDCFNQTYRYPCLIAFVTHV